MKKPIKGLIKKQITIEAINNLKLILFELIEKRNKVIANKIKFSFNNPFAQKSIPELQIIKKIIK